MRFFLLNQFRLATPLAISYGVLKILIYGCSQHAEKIAVNSICIVFCLHPVLSVHDKLTNERRIHLLGDGRLVLQTLSFCFNIFHLIKYCFPETLLRFLVCGKLFCCFLQLLQRLLIDSELPHSFCQSCDGLLQLSTDIVPIIAQYTMTHMLLLFVEVAEVDAAIRGNSHFLFLTL